MVRRAAVKIVVSESMIITNTNQLHTICEAVSLDEAADIISLLEKELELNNKGLVKGIGLAAPQIGINKRVAIIRIGDDLILNLVNAIIVEKHNLVESSEGCLSLPGQKISVMRYNDIVVENGDGVKYSAYKMGAICIQHEMDHWEGKLITDVANIGPNMPCICGSKLKYKKCCGRGKK